MNIFKSSEPPRHTALTVAALLLTAFSLLAAPVAAQAQENATSPPAPLQWPTLEPGPANGGLAISLVRNRIEEGANGELCKQLMTDAGTPIPPNFTFALCPARFRDQIAAREGKVRWVQGAKPTECGTNCVGRPFTATSSFRDRPNTFFAQLFGHLDFRVDVPNLPDRTVRYGYQAQFHCLTQSGAREGNVNVRVTFDRPTVIEGGFLEGVLNFIVPVNLSNAVEAAIRARLSTPGSENVMLGRCSSIGAVKAADPADDLISFNIPRSTPNRPGVIVGGTSVLNTRSATVRFHRITRKPVFGFTPPNESGQFHIFLNGIQGNFPITPPLNLPASGGSAEINLCKTIDMKDADRLQLIFVNSHGGAVWSQFGPNTTFGAGRSRTMTTSRTVMVAGRPSPPGVPTPGPGGARPEPRVLNEFELSYTIEFNSRPGEVIAPRTVTGGGGVAPQGPGRPGILTTDTGKSAQPCRSI